MSYDQLVSSDEFSNNLQELNNKLRQALEEKGYIPVLIGNLFYAHMQHIPRFYESPLYPSYEPKRRALVELARKATLCMEIGFNGGHSSFLCLQANPVLNIIASDICDFDFFPTVQPGIYVRAARDYFLEKYPGQFNFIEGNSLHTLPEFVNDNKHLQVDLLHLDEHKDNYITDFYNLKPLLKTGCRIIFDDTDNPSVLQQISKLLNKGEIAEIPGYVQVNQAIESPHLVYMKLN